MGGITMLAMQAYSAAAATLYAAQPQGKIDLGTAAQMVHDFANEMARLTKLYGFNFVMIVDAGQAVEHLMALVVADSNGRRIVQWFYYSGGEHAPHQQVQVGHGTN